MRLNRSLKLAAVAALAAGLSLAGLAEPAMAAPADNQMMLNGQDGINSYRAAAGAAAITESANLDQLAQARADKGAQDGIIYHDATYWNTNLTPGTAWGETLVNGYGLTPDEVASAWENSNAHRPIMEDNRYTQIGLGWATATDGQAFAVAIFVQPGVAVPGAVQNVNATKSGTRGITATWSAPTTGGTFTGYQVSVFDVNGNIADLQHVDANATSYTFPSLNRGKSYFVKVLAYNSVGNGAAMESNAPIDITYSVPSAPAVFTASQTGDYSARFVWSAPTDNGGTNLQGYHTELYKDGQPYRAIDTTDSALSVDNLPDGSTYKLQVQAFNASGNGALSDFSTDVVLPSVVQTTAPSAPLNPQLTGSRTGQLTATWSQPASDGNSAISAYTVTVYQNGSYYTSAMVSALTATVFVPADQGGVYTIAVKALNAVGVSSMSTLSSEVSMAAAVVSTNVPAVSTPVVQTPATSATSTDTASQPTVSQSSPKVNNALPSKVGTLGATAVKTTSAKLVWSRPSANGNGSINRYLVSVYRYSHGKYVFWKQAKVRSSALKPVLTLTKLAAKTRYAFKVQAFSTRGSTTSYVTAWHGAYSSSKIFTTKK